MPQNSPFPQPPRNTTATAPSAPSLTPAAPVSTAYDVRYRAQLTPYAQARYGGAAPVAASSTPSSLSSFSPTPAPSSSPLQPLQFGKQSSGSDTP